MTSRSFDEHELLELIGAVRDEQITPEQVARLESIIGENVEARQFYIRAVTMHGLFEQSVVAIPPASPTEKPTPVTLPSAERSWRRRSWQIAALAAAVLIGVSIWWFAGKRSNDDPHKTIVPAWEVIPTGNARFVKLTATSLRLERGEIRIRRGKADGKQLGGTGKLEGMNVETPSGKVIIYGSDVLIGTHNLNHSQKQGDSDMKHFTRVLILAGVATLLNQHGSVRGETNDLLLAQPGKAPVKQMIQANTAFAIDLYRQLSKEQAGKNLFVSPYSISIALAMAVEGARGKTAEEMGKVLHFPKAARRVGGDAQLIPWRTSLIHTGMAQISGDLMRKAKKAKHPFELRIVNALWADQTTPFRQQFVARLNDSYGTGGAYLCDFVNKAEQERTRINNWVAEKTNNRIKDLLPAGSLHNSTRLVLTNAIYFQGAWQQVFDRRKTKPADFFTVGGKRVKVPMMSGTFENVKFAFIGKGNRYDSLVKGREGNFRLVELPYKGGLSMVLIAPDHVRGLPQLEAQLTPDNLSKWLGRLRAEEIVQVTLPRFKFSTAYELPKTLRQLGMIRAFEAPRPNGGADFSGMSESEKLYIGGVYHKTFIAVDEEGTEAGAATGVAGFLGGPPRFAGDRPFLFLIRDPQSQTILFMGRITDAAKVANNDRSIAEELRIKLARTAPTKHPLYKRMKDASGVAIIRPAKDPAQGLGDFRCRVVKSLKGELKSGTVARFVFITEAFQSDARSEFFQDVANKKSRTVLAIYKRQADRFIVEDVVEADEAALLIASHLFSIPYERLSKIAGGGASAGK